MCVCVRVCVCVWKDNPTENPSTLHFVALQSVLASFSSPWFVFIAQNFTSRFDSLSTLLVVFFFTAALHATVSLMNKLYETLKHRRQTELAN